MMIPGRVVQNYLRGTQGPKGDMGNGAPKNVYATTAALAAALPEGDTNIYVVSADGHWYFWDGSAWTDGGVYQSAGIATNAVKLANFNEDVFIFSDSVKVVNSTSLGYVEMVFDFAPYTLSTSDKMTVGYDFYTDSANIAQVGTNIFLNNNPALGSYTGGTTLSTQYMSAVAASQIKNYSQERENYSATYRYAHVTALIDLTATTLTEWYLRNMTLRVGSQSIAPITSYGLLFPATGASISTPADRKIGPNAAKYADIVPLVVATADYTARTTPFDGFTAESRPANVANPIYLEMVFDLNPYTLSTADKFKIMYDFFAESNISTIGSRIFLNDDARLGYPTGGIVYGTDYNATYAAGTIQSYSQERENYIATHRYAHVFITPKLTDGTTLTPMYFRGLKLFVGTTEIAAITTYAVYSAPVASPVTAAEYISIALATKGDLGLISTARWEKKAAVIEGDSITKGDYWDSVGEEFVNTLYPFWVWLGNILGLSTITGYGISSTTISSQSAHTADNFISRYDAMSDDADLIIVFGGTNDFGFDTPLGTIADTTDISFYGALDVLMAGLVNKYLGKRIVFMTPLHRDNDTVANGVGATLVQYVDAIIAKAGLYGIPVIDTYRISGLHVNVAAARTAYINDGLHPNVAGHALLAQNIAGQFAAL